MADVAVPGALDATGTMTFNSFGGNTAAVPQVPTAADPADAPNGIEITPIPQSYGWGVVRNLSNLLLAEDLSGFAGGTLHFSIRTTYAGKIEVGFSTGSHATTDAFDVWMPLSPGQYGYLNDGQWNFKQKWFCCFYRNYYITNRCYFSICRNTRSHLKRIL